VAETHRGYASTLPEAGAPHSLEPRQPLLPTLRVSLHEEFS